MGSGGNASSFSSATTTGDSFATATATATGGTASYDGPFVRFASAGGNASSVASANSPDGVASASSTATGGGGSTLGTATASANSTTLGGVAQSDAFATGSSGTAQTHSQAASGLISALNADTHVPVTDVTSHSQSWASVGHTAPSIPAGLQSMAAVVGLPIITDSLAALTGNPNAHHDLNISGEGTGASSDVLAMVALGSVEGSAGLSQTFVAITSMSIDLSQLSSQQDLYISLLDPTSIGSGFDSLRFRVTHEGSSLIDLTFTDAASALSYFNDRSLDEGVIGAGVTGTLDLSLELDLTTHTAGSGFATDMLLSNATNAAGPVPEPTFVAICLPLAAFNLRRRSRNST